MRQTPKQAEESGFPGEVFLHLGYCREAYPRVQSVLDGWGRMMTALKKLWQEVPRFGESPRMDIQFDLLVEVAALAQRTAEDCGFIAEQILPVSGGTREDLGLPPAAPS